MHKSPDPTTGSQRELALEYAAQAYPVFPVNPFAKRPCNAHGHLEATTDNQQIETWWRRWPCALVAIPTGSRTNLWVLDVDGAVGRQSLNGLLAQLGKDFSEITPCIVSTPSSGLHSYFTMRSGEHPRTRASDIAPSLDTRGEGGYIIAPGNRLPDGREYRWIGHSHDLADAVEAPRLLIFLATFNTRERAEIESIYSLRSAIINAEAGWTDILERHRQQKAQRILSKSPHAEPNAMRRQALHDLQEVASEYAGRQDGRRNGLFSVTCKLARYVVNSVLSESELRSALCEAAAANGALSVHGSYWFDGVMRRALACGARDSLPPLARQFREIA
jgi:hypothetical protein